MNKQLILIEPNKLHNVWATHVLPGLTELITEGENPGGWNADHIYDSIQQKQASLFLMKVDDEDAGFIVLQVSPKYDGKALHIWLAYSRPIDGKSKNVMMTFNDNLNSMARNLECTEITFSSTRDFWSNVAPKFGFEVERTIYKRKVTPQELTQ